MKTSLVIIIALVVGLAQAKDCVSPNGRFAVRAESVITLIDVKTGQQLLVLNDNTSFLTRVEIAWSPDSTKVGMVTDARRGSGVYAAWLNGSSWHKTLERDSDLIGVIERAEKEFGGRLVAENRTFHGWATPDALRVQGTMHLTSGKQCQYQYLLEFHPNAVTHLDRGGYEEGAIVGKDFTML
jgi:hypothetical protein